MHRELTMEDRELANAGYEHLVEEKEKSKAGGKDADLDKVDIVEHSLTFAALADTLATSIDPKNGPASAGLTSAEVQTRLARDGKNMLTPPKKKSAFRKVC